MCWARPSSDWFPHKENFYALYTYPPRRRRRLGQCACGHPGNRSLSGLVLSVERDGVMAQVEILCGEYRMTSLMTRDAADALGLEPGVRATAVVKATKVIIET